MIAVRQQTTWRRRERDAMCDVCIAGLVFGLRAPDRARQPAVVHQGGDPPATTGTKAWRLATEEVRRHHGAIRRERLPPVGTIRPADSIRPSTSTGLLALLAAGAQGLLCGVAVVPVQYEYSRGTGVGVCVAAEPMTVRPDPTRMRIRFQLQLGRSEAGRRWTHLILIMRGTRPLLW